MSFDIKIQKNKGAFDLIPEGSVTNLKFRVKDVLDDIADNIEYQASIFAPESEPDDKEGGSASYIPSGALREHPVDITETGFGRVANIQREAEGFRSVQAPAGATDPITGKKIGGQFVKGKATTAGHIFYTTTITYPEDPFYAKYVAFGTGVYGPRHQPITSTSGKPMKFKYLGKRWKLDFVMGQRPQPYLNDATQAVNVTYIPIKMRELRAGL